MPLPRCRRLLLVLTAGLWPAGSLRAAEPPTWDDTRVRGWGAAFENIAIPPALAGSPAQRAMWHASSKAEPQPLIVSLHTWSGDFTQQDPLAEVAVAKGFNYIHPDFRGPNNRPEACGSDLVVADLDAAIDYALARGNVDRSNIHLIGVSGGGHATMLAWMRSRHDVRSFAAWVGISDLEKWYHESVGRGARYATDLCQVTTGDPARFDPVEARKRSPLFHATPVARRQGSRLLLFTGVHDGYTGSVPITQTIDFYNHVVRDLAPAETAALVPAEISEAMLRQRSLPSGNGAATKPKHGETIYQRKFQDRVHLTVFEGGHEMLVEQAFDHIPPPAPAATGGSRGTPATPK